MHSLYLTPSPQLGTGKSSYLGYLVDEKEGMLLATWGKMYRTLSSVRHHPFLTVPKLLLKLSKYRQSVQLCAGKEGED